jgi:hypothetical protein
MWKRGHRPKALRKHQHSDSRKKKCARSQFGQEEFSDQTVVSSLGVRPHLKLPKSANKNLLSSIQLEISIYQSASGDLTLSRDMDDRLYFLIEGIESTSEFVAQ